MKYSHISVSAATNAVLSSRWQRVEVIFVILFLAGVPGLAGAVDTLVALALTRDRAIINIDGERRVLKVGDVSPEGVRLLQSSSSLAIVEYNGEKIELAPSTVTAPIGLSNGSGQPGRVVLWADNRGFFHVDGHINGHSVKFLVDTGANTIAMSSVTAREIGLDLASGKQGIASTASGMARIVGVTLDEVSIGPITLFNVSAGVIDGNSPSQPLLGASFLEHLEMRRQGSRMELIRR